MSKDNVNYELSEYIKSSDLTTSEKAKVWSEAIGLQEVDGLKPSEYLLENAKEHIEGKIEIREVEKRINSYYKALDNRKLKEMRDFEEADKVSLKIAEILSDDAFVFKETELLNIHRKLFTGVYSHAGLIRDYNITKEEWVLNGETVIYADHANIMETLKYDFNEEKNFSYKDISQEEFIRHFSRFISNIWQVHPFGEGNTRTIAVFTIKYLRKFGFDLNDEAFSKNSWYFRNSLVRANYSNYRKRIFEDYTFLERFFSNLIDEGNFELKNRYTHIDYKEGMEETYVSKGTMYNEEQTIIDLIQKNPNVKQSEIATVLNKSLRTVKTRMDDMQKRNVIKRENGKRNAKWKVNEK